MALNRIVDSPGNNASVLKFRLQLQNRFVTTLEGVFNKSVDRFVQRLDSLPIEQGGQDDDARLVVLIDLSRAEVKVRHIESGRQFFRVAEPGWSACFEEGLDPVGHIAELFFLELGKYRNGEDLPGQFFCDGQVSGFSLQRAEAFLQVEGDRVVDLRGDLVFREEFAQRITRFRVVATQGVLVVDMPGGWCFRQAQRRFGALGQPCLRQQPGIGRGIFRALLGGFIKPAEARPDQGRLQGVEPKIASDDSVVVFGRASMDAEDADFFSQLGIPAGNQPPVPAGAEVLGREE